MRCKYCHSTDHTIDRCQTIVCRNCKGIGHPVWTCPLSASTAAPSDSTSPESTPNESLPETSNKEQPSWVIEDHQKVAGSRQSNENNLPVNQSSYWKKKVDANTMDVNDTSYKFGSTNSLASPKNAVSPRIPSAASLRHSQSGLSVESNGGGNGGGNGKRRDRVRDRDRNRERDHGRDHARDQGRERNQGWVSSDLSAPMVPPKSRNDEMMPSRGSNTRYGDFGEFRNKNSQKESIPSTGSLRSIPDAPSNDSNHFMNQKVDHKVDQRRSNHQQPMQHRKEKQHVSDRNESAEVSREQPVVIKAEEITVNYYQKMVGANWGDLVISAGFGSKSS